MDRRQAGSGKMRRDMGTGAPLPPDPVAILGTDIASWYRTSESPAGEPYLTIAAGVVQTWTDRLNGDAPTQPTANLRPAYSATGMGSGAAVVGTGTQYLTANLSTLPLANSRPYIWAVLKLDSTAGVQYSVSPAGGGANGLRLFSNHFEGRWNCVGGLDAIVGPVADTNPHLIETGALATTAARLVVDGVAYAGNRTDAIAASQTSLWLLCSNTGLNIMTGRLSEFVISKNPPSAAQLLAMRAYFRARPYGLTIA